MATWHGDTFGPRVVFGQGLYTGVSSLIPVEMDSVRQAGLRASAFRCRERSVAARWLRPRVAFSRPV